ncbi:hypothetical protein HII36_46930 [Nonomuraea sp. NN258]|uniref:DUF5984 family protein n=1 Tax=Nonomuraea antri TaxID=2730852 RepID=UPI001568B1E0|nr:DUF5984 family protein [Nonomuraea antri]NRQ39309.1 hypothetical protein [Nonomuraea antri]
MIRFRYEMRPLTEVSPWGGDRPVLHWFALTEAWYRIEVGGHELFRCDYYLARPWEDVLGMTPEVLEPVPPDLAWFVEHEPAGVPDEDPPKAVWDALTWHGGHTLDVSPFHAAPSVRMWRMLGETDEVLVTWHNPEHEDMSFTGPRSGRLTVPTPEFTAAIRDFGQAVVATMAARVAELERTGPPAGVELDLAQLRAEHLRRAGFPDEMLSRTPDTDWATVRRGAALLREHWR